MPRSTGSAVRRAKLRPPVVSAQVVRRARLINLMHSAVESRVTLVTAGAGTGKTTLVAAWSAETAITTAWVSLDNTDRDVGAFWATIIAGLGTLVPGCGAQAVALLRRGGTLDTTAEVVGELLDDLDAQAVDPSVLIVDDVHLVDDVEAITASLNLFVRHLPAWLHLVLLSRRDVALPTGRLRAEGLLGEVQFAELRFAPDESRELLQLLAPDLSEQSVDTAAARADGWAAGLRLAALAARSAAARGSVEPDSGHDRLVHDFLLRDVLAAEDPDLVEFLFGIAVTERVNPGLAEALTHRSDAHECLSRAEARGLFVSRLGASGWFQMHSLARAALTAELASRSAEQFAQQHARAAQWFEEMGETPLALEHWLLAGRERDALRLLAEKTADLYDSGRDETIRTVMAAISLDIVTTDLNAMIEFAWCHLFVDRRRFGELVDQLAWWAQRSNAEQPVLGRVMHLQSANATMNGRWVEGGALARAALRDLGGEAWRDPFGRFCPNLIAREIALSERWDDDGEEVRETRLALGRDPKRRLAFEGTRALGEALAGRPVDALRVASGVRHAVSVSEMSILRAELFLAEAIALREAADHVRAIEKLRLVTARAAEVALYCTIRAQFETVLAHLDIGDLPAAEEVFGEARALVDAESFGRNGRDWLGTIGTVLALAGGDGDAALAFAGAIEDPFWATISTARVEISDGDRKKAAATLTLAAPRCVRHEVVHGLLTALVGARPEDTVKAAVVAVERAAAVGMVQTVASEGPEVLELVERAAWRAPSSWMHRVRLAATAAEPKLDQLRLIEPLTDREREVLRFLPSRLTIREIADELYVSMNTLKFHLKMIYRKLGVSSRSEAAEAARSISHLPKRAP